MRWGVLLAGGVGARFWPKSRPSRPKQCLALDPDSDRTLLQLTFDRLGLPAERVLVSTGTAMADVVREQLDVPDANVLVEPSGRNTAPAIAWAGGVVEQRGGGTLVVLPTDHRIEDVPSFRGAIDRAVEAAESWDVVLVGIEPTRPETGFGWIRADGQRVAAFVEKPVLERARQLQSEGALWNAGIFVARHDRLRHAFDVRLPGCWTADWDDKPRISFDHGVLELHDRVGVVPGDFGWSDLGSWTALGALLERHDLGRAAVRGGVALDGGDHVVFAPDKIVATLGVHDLVIVDDGDVLLICRKEDAQRVRELAAKIDALP